MWIELWGGESEDKNQLWQVKALKASIAWRFWHTTFQDGGLGGGGGLVFKIY